MFLGMVAIMKEETNHFLRNLTIITSKFVHALVEPLRSTSLLVLKYGALIHLVCSLVDRGVATIVSLAYSGIPGDVDDFFHFLVSDATRFLSSIPPIDYPGLVAFFVCIIYLICACAYELERKIERLYFYQNMCWRTLVSWLKLVYRAPTELTVGKFVRRRRQATSTATTVKILLDCQSKLRFLTDEVDKVYEAYTTINDTLSRLLQVESDDNSKVNQITRMLQASKSERQVLVKITESQGSLLNEMKQSNLVIIKRLTETSDAYMEMLKGNEDNNQSERERALLVCVAQLYEGVAARELKFSKERERWLGLSNQNVVQTEEAASSNLDWV